MWLSDKIKSITPSATLSITSLAKQMKKDGEDVVILAAGEPDFDTPDIIKQAAIKAINDGFTKYTPASGTLTLKSEICRKLKKDNGLDYEPGQIVVSNGAKHSIYNALQAICNPGDEVLIVPPYWVSYPEMVKLAGAVSVVVEVDEANRFKTEVSALEKAVTNKTKALILNSPSNPAGVIYNKAELLAIAAFCLEKNILVISDEIYEKIIYDGKEHFSIASCSEEMKNSTILVNGMSKSYSMTGWRIGYIAANKEIVSLVSSLQSHATSNPCSISQVAAETALTADLDDELKKNSDIFQARRDAILEMFKDEDKISCLVPSGAFYMFCDISKCGMGSLEFAKKLLDEKKVAVIPGGPFGDDRFIRISFATDSDTLEKGINRIKEWIN